MERQGLRVIDGRLSDQTRIDEARIELLARLAEFEDFCDKGIPVVTEWKQNLEKQRERTAAARAEILWLAGGHSNDAA